MSSFFTEFMIQPVLVGVYVLTKDVLYDGYLPENPHVLIDVFTNVLAKFLSAFVTVELIVPYTIPTATWVEPVIHGGINGAIKSQFINTDNLSIISAVSARRLPPIRNYTFENGFIEGATYNALSKLSTLPIEALGA